MCTRNTLKTLCLALSVVAVLGAASLSVPAAHAAGPVALTNGDTYGEWSASWWQWLTSIPAAQNPQVGEGAVDCTLNQGGPVWYLAGAPTGTTAVRTCTVPTGKKLFFPVLNAIFTNSPGESFTVAEKRELLDGVLNDLVPGFFTDFGLPGSRACGLFAELDGTPLVYFVPQARTQSPAFHFETGDGAGFLTPGVVDPEAVSDGFWIMMPSLTPGEHTLRFGGRFCQFESFDDHPVFGPVDVTYHLTVQGPGTGGGTNPPPGQLSNAEIVLSLYDAFAVGDLDTINAIIHPDVVWIESEGIPYGGTFIGRDAVFEGVFGKIAAEWTGFTAVVDEIFEADGNRVVTLGRDSGTFNATGKSMVAPTSSIWTLNEQGQVVRFVQYIDTLAVVSATIPD